MDGSMTTHGISLSTMVFSYNLGVTHAKKAQNDCRQLTYHELLITNFLLTE
jgi:hypothetical protein